MPSERRLHPASILFGLGGQLREWALPGIFAIFGAKSAGFGWETWFLLFLIPVAITSLGRYLTFRYRYEDNEIVFRSGLVFRSERHVPYARIQSLDAVQNVVHRMLGVAEVRVQTGGGEEPEATLSVLPMAELAEMRRRVFAGRTGASPVEAAAGAPPPARRTLLQLPVRELVLLGLVRGRGLLVLGAAFGLLWELGLWDGLMGRVFGDDGGGSGVARELGRAFLGKGGLPVGRILVGLLAFLAFLLAVRLLSIVWSLIRLHGFRLTLEGDDLRVEYGLLTRVTATVPVHRIQSVTVLEGPLHRLVGRVAVKVQTAGGGGQQREASTESEWIAPILRREELSALLAAMGPELAIEGASWNPPHPRAFRRELKGWVIVAIVLSLPFVLALRFWDLALLSALLGLGALAARLTVRHMAWAVTAGAVLYRSGFLWRHLTIARCDKVQAVARTESPFDRRAGMAGVRVDTAGGGELSHRVDIPYLARQTADELAALLSARAARTAFRW